MSISEPAVTADPYNDVAIALARRLQAERDQAAAGPAPEPDTASLFPAHNLAGLGVAREYERMGRRPVSDALAAAAADLDLELEHLGLTLGTVVHGIDLKQPLSPEQAACLRRTLLERKVIFFRGQHLDPAQQAALGRCFGDLDAFPFGRLGEDPHILEIVHGPRNPGTENSWHTDVTWMEQPSLGSIAQCVEVPDHGGDTLFSDSHACYLGLRPELRARIRDLDGINDYRIFLARIPEHLHHDFKAAIPFGVAHPLARTHPETGKTALFIHGGFLRHDSLFERASGEALDADESRAIVRELLQQHARPEYQVRFRWSAGDVAFWDNRASQHYAVSDYFPQRRVLRRVTVRGDRPYYDPAADPLDASL